MVTQFSVLGLQTLTSPGRMSREPTITGPWGWAYSTLAKNQREISRGVYVGAGKAPADMRRTLALALLNCHLLTKVCES